MNQKELQKTHGFEPAPFTERYGPPAIANGKPAQHTNFQSRPAIFHCFDCPPVCQNIRIGCKMMPSICLPDSIPQIFLSFRSYRSHYNRSDTTNVLHN